MVRSAGFQEGSTELKFLYCHFQDKCEDLSFPIWKMEMKMIPLIGSLPVLDETKQLETKAK